MYEAELIRQVIARVSLLKSQAHLGRVPRITLRIPEHSPLDPRALKLTFERMRSACGWDDVRMDVIQRPPRAYCRDCGLLEPAASLWKSCPRCRSMNWGLQNDPDLIVDAEDGMDAVPEAPSRGTRRAA